MATRRALILDTDGLPRRMPDGDTLLGASALYVDQTPAASGYGTLSGLVNGANQTFQVSQGGYAAGKLLVLRNGLPQIPGVDYTASSPSTGVFTTAAAWPTGAVVTAVYGTDAATTTTGSGGPVLLNAQQVNLKTTGLTTLYTVPAGKYVVVSGLVLACQVATAITSGPTVSLGTVASGYADVFPATTLTGFVNNTAGPTGNAWAFTSVGLTTQIVAGTAIRFNVTTASAGTAQNANVYLYGWVYP